MIVSIMVIVLVVIGFNFLNKPTTYAYTIKYDNLGYPWNDATLIDPSNYDWGYPANSCPANDPNCTRKIAGANTVLNGKQYGVSDPWGYEFKNCTSYVAWKVESLGGNVPGNLENGGQWYKNSPASEQSLIPQKWDAAVEPESSKHPYGHVAFVESVNSIDSSNPGNDNITVSEYNEDYKGDGDYRTGTAASMGFTEFVNFGFSPKSTTKQTSNPNPAIYAKKIVQWNGDTKAQKTSWLVWPVSSKLVRYWIPDISTYYCLINEGYPDAGPVSSDILNQLPDQTGQKATCVKPPVNTLSNSTPTANKILNTPTVSVSQNPTSTSSPTSTPTTTATPTPTPTPQTTWTEQSGTHGSPTFQNPNNASGQGTTVSAMSYVQVSCRIYAPQISSANPDGWWYRIASSPWNGAYYAVANTFWNGDIPGHPPYTHNTDFAVPVC